MWVEFLVEKFEGVGIWAQKFEGLTYRASAGLTPHGGACARDIGVSRANLPCPGRWTTQSYQGVWGPCVSAWMTGAQGVGWVGRGSRAASKVRQLHSLNHTSPRKLDRWLYLKGSTATAAKTAVFTTCTSTTWTTPTTAGATVRPGPLGCT